MGAAVPTKRSPPKPTASYASTGSFVGTRSSISARTSGGTASRGNSGKSSHSFGILLIGAGLLFLEIAAVLFGRGGGSDGHNLQRLVEIDGGGGGGGVDQPAASATDSGRGATTAATTQLLRTTSSSGNEDGAGYELADAMDEAVRLLLPAAEAEEYVRRHPAREFRFYVYDDLPEEVTYPFLTKCVEGKLNVPDWWNAQEKGNATSNCGWAEVCTETRTSSSQYSTRRFNRNADVLLARAFLEYNGKLRTYDARQADAYVVPYPSSAHCACQNQKPQCTSVSDENIRELVHDNLKYYNAMTKTRHIFLSSSQIDINHPFMMKQDLVLTIQANPDVCPIDKSCGQVTIPYANLNPEYQPNRIADYHRHDANDGGDNGDSDPGRDRKYAIGSAIVRQKTYHAKRQVRAMFVKEAGKYLQGGNRTLGNMPTAIAGVNALVNILGAESETLQLYRDSVFCPILRGDAPPQKRQFDVLLSGCVPVVLSYPSDDGPDHPSHFEPGKFSIRTVYPFAKGIFAGRPDMGIDYRKMVVEVDGTNCGVECVLPALDDLLLNHPSKVVDMQRRIARASTLFSYGAGAGENAFRYPDAVAAALVQARQYIIHEHSPGQVRN